ncbi:MAG: VacJ family lipoprotein [Pseudomonadales bacterium]
MNCSTTATLAAFDIYESGAAIRRAGNDYTFLMFAVMIAVWLFAIPLTAHAGQDPLIGMNRSVHGFNKAMDTTVLKPLAETYTTVTPGFVKRRVTSFFNNIDDVRVIINDLLQLKLKRAAADTGRLAVNTTVGVGGLFDVAKPALGLEKHYEDFGQTLGYWSVDSGAYIELPFIGPSTVRDSAGVLVDVLLNPLQFLGGWERSSLVASEGVNDRASLLEAEKLITGDEYAFIREVYLQRRELLVNDGRSEDTFSDFDSDWDFEEEELETAMTLAGE